MKVPLLILWYMVISTVQGTLAPLTSGKPVNPPGGQFLRSPFIPLSWFSIRAGMKLCAFRYTGYIAGLEFHGDLGRFAQFFFGRPNRKQTVRHYQ
jgi:hypothetical protein